MSRQPRNWLCLITNDREMENIAELVEGVSQYFDGICAVVHKQGGDDHVRKHLEEHKGAGFVIEREFQWHHGHAMNHWLFDRRIQLRDACWIRDSSERFNRDFAAQIPDLSESLLSQGIWNLAQHSKLLMFRRWFNQQFVNGLHWGLSGLYGNTIALDQVPQFANDRDCAYSVRAEKRPADHRYRHEVLYLLDYAPNGNHLQLFHPNPQELDKAQWTFFTLLERLHADGISSVDQLAEYLSTQKTLDTTLKTCINAERPLRNFYRYYILGHTNEEILRDEDQWRIPE